MTNYLSSKKSTVTKLLIVCLLTIFFLVDFSCIERFYLDSQIKPEYQIVVDALITDKSEEQQIRLSKTSSPEIYSIAPLSDCMVIVKDQTGNEFVFEEKVGATGLYEGTIEDQYLKNGIKLMLYFRTNNGVEYASEFEEFFPCPQIDSIYYEIKRLPTSDPQIFEDGIQFYVDYIGSETDARFLRWQLQETWEYHSVWPIRNYIDEDNVYHNSLADYSYFICYKTVGVDKVFTLNTENLIQNRYKKFPLHFVNDHTQRLLYRYSLLVKLCTLSESAYNFWEKLKKNNQESGGLFDSQPSLVKGNIHNISNPNEKVLGYFGVSSVSEKRLNVYKITEFAFSLVPTCGVMHVDPPDYRPLYFIEDGWAERECFDCRLLRGTTELPDFWKE